MQEPARNDFQFHGRYANSQEYPCEAFEGNSRTRITPRARTLKANNSLFAFLQRPAREVATTLCARERACTCETGQKRREEKCVCSGTEGTPSPVKGVEDLRTRG